MRLPVLIEPMPDSRYRATGGSPLFLTAEGDTRDEALTQLQRLVEERLAGGSELVAVEVRPERHPWLAFAGMYEQNELFDDWQEAIAERRSQEPADPPG